MSTFDKTALLAEVSDFGTYASLAVRTKSPNFNYGAPGTIDILHAVIGLTGEVRELRDALDVTDQPADTVNALEEAGDMYWYCGVIYRALVEQAPELLNQVYPSVVLPPAYRTSRLVEVVDKAAHVLQNQVKRCLFYNSSQDGFIALSLAPVATILLSTLLPALAELVKGLGSTPEEVCATNILKLGGPGGRFAGAFSDVAALQRNLGQERAILDRNLNSSNGK